MRKQRREDRAQTREMHKTLAAERGSFVIIITGRIYRYIYICMPSTLCFQGYAVFLYSFITNASTGAV